MDKDIDNYTPEYDDMEMNSNIAYVAELEDKIAKLSEENKKLSNEYLYLRAELDNVNKRYKKQIDDMKTTACADTVNKFIYGINDLAAAVKNTNDEGISLIYKKFEGILNSLGVEVIMPKNGDNFNVDTMSALSLQSSDNEELKNKVATCVEQGYKIGDKVIKFAQVIVYY